MDYFKFHEMEIYWLVGGHTALDGGAMFGVVPKPLWSRKYLVDEFNRIETPTDPLLIRYQNKNYLIDASIGTKLTDKQKKNYGVLTEPKLEESLADIGLTVNDIDFILMTHFHFDHAGGLTKIVNDQIVSTFPNATIYVHQIEWDEVRNPNIRSKNTYFRQNWEAIEHQVKPFSNNLKINESIEMIHTGGHSNGHCIVRLTQASDVIVHMADLMATHAHQNPLWVMAYDDYPIDSIHMKQKYLMDGYKNGVIFSFYHDAFYRLIKWDSDGKEIVYSLKRGAEPIIKGVR